MKKIDLKKELKHLYLPSAKEVVQVDVPAFQFLMIDGEGDPNTSQAYAQAVEAHTQRNSWSRRGHKQSTIRSCPLKGFGGLTTCSPLPPMTSQSGNGR